MDCFPLSETPEGSGFGGAAIALTPQFLMKPAQLKGKPVLSTVNIPINWEPMGGPNETFGAKRVIPGDLPWTEAPSFADVAAAYPKKAREDKIGGRATMACDLTEEGRLSGCNVPTIEPKGYGFDTAAKALSKKFRFAVSTDADRKATHGLEIHLTMVFDPSMLTDGAPSSASRVGWPSQGRADAGRLRHPGRDQHRAGDPGVRRSAGGTVAGCKVDGEEPAGKGVGAAALSLAPAFRLTTWTAEGLPTVGGTIRIPIRYEPGEAAAAAK
jgi:TonB family protein